MRRADKAGWRGFSLKGVLVHSAFFQGNEFVPSLLTTLTVPFDDGRDMGAT